MVIVGVLVLAAVALPLQLHTALGAHERGVSVGLSALAGAFFPVTWTVWYLRDEHPYRKANDQAA